MRGFLSVFKHELTLYKANTGTYVFVILAILATVLCTFYLGGFLNSNQATFKLFFGYLPWIFLFFIPVFVMGVWADEWRRGTAERIFTLPVRPLAVSLAKFFAAWSVFTLLLISMASIPFTVMYLGNPDMGPLWSGYIGSFLLGGVFIGISFLGSSLSRSQTGGVSISLVLIFMLLAAGWGIFTNMLIGSVPPEFLNVLVQYSILDKYRYFVDGVISFSGVIFFISLAILFLGLSHVVIRKRLGLGGLVTIVPLILVFILVNWGARYVHYKADLTEIKIHSIAAASEKLISEIDGDVTVKLYYSSQNVSVPGYSQKFMVKVKDMLRHLKGINPEHIKIEEINPERSIELEIDTANQGIQEIPLGMGESYYMGITFTMDGRTTGLPLLDPTRQEHLEFDIISAIHDLSQTKRFKIGILTDLDLGDDRMRPRFMSELMANYNVDLLGRDEPTIDQSTDVVIVFMTPYLTMERVYALDQYMANGGHIMLFLDPFLRTAPTDDYKIADRNADNANIDHPADLLRHWGVEYDYSSIVGDHSRAVPVEVNKKGVTTYPLWLYFSERDVNTDLPFMANLSEIFLIESGGFEKKNVKPNLKYQSVLSTSENGQTVPRYLFDKEDFKVAGSLLTGDKRSIDTAFMLTGKFDSVFKTQPKEVIQYYRDYALDPSKLNLPKHVVSGEKAGALIAIADMDFLTDDYAIAHKTIQGKEVFKPANDNLVFVFNAIQFLLGDSDLLTLKGKNNKKYPFERIEQMLIDASADYQAIEQKMVRQLFMVSQKLQALQKRSKTAKQVNKDVEHEIQKFRSKELELRKELRELRRNFRTDIERMSRIITLLNLCVIPLIIAISALVFFARRRRKASA
jgi:ABC-type uncharacterized transport system involved in gliding motility auxiliary subunit/ABC-type transport system involved in multi-copper enzyme maturation permease subunit